MAMQNVEEVKIGDRIIAIIIRSEFSKDGVAFFTPGDFSQQLGYLKHRSGDRIQEHIHRLQVREVKYTQETLFIKRGRVRVDFYRDDRVFFTSRECKTGDAILLASGGHGFEFLEETEMLEVKQGPYSNDADKVRFEGIKGTASDDQHL